MTQQQENFNALIHGLADILSDKEKVESIRPSQQKVLKDFLHSPEQYKTGIFDLATAFGKTRIMALLADAYHQNADHQIVVVEPTQELVHQIAEEFSDYFSDNKKVGKFFAERKDTRHPILVTTYNSLEKLAQIVNPDSIGLLLLDEGHHAVSDKRVEIVRRFSNACQYGMTATPDYSEDRTLKNLLGNTIAHIDIRQGIYDGILSPFSNVILFSKFQLDLSKVKRTGTGEYDIADYHQAFSKALSPVHMPNTEDTGWQDAHRRVAHEVALFYQSLASDKKHCLINCHTQEEAQIQAEEINKVFGRKQAGAWTTDSKNTHALSEFESGKLGALCQVGMLQEGYDFPALDMCINYPTASWVRATQRGGRTLRLDPQNPDKQATIVDIVLGFPGSKNPYTSARKNGQVLYSDVVKAIYVAPKSLSTFDRKQPLSFPPTIHLDLKHFKVVSNIRNLLTLKREDQQREAAEYVPPKLPGMLSANDLSDVMGGTPNKYFELLQEIHKNPELNFHCAEDGQTFQLVHYVKSGNAETYCLSNHPEAMKFFTEICATKYKRRYFESVSLDDYAKGHYLPLQDLKDICRFLQGLRFTAPDDEGKQHLLISKRQHHPDTLLLSDTEVARSDLNAIIHLTDYLWRVPGMSDDRYDFRLFKDRMALPDSLVDPFIKRAIIEGKTYTDKNGQRRPLVQFYSQKDAYCDDQANSRELYYGICVPRDIEGQKALLRFCGFNIYHCDSSKITNRLDYWDVYKRSKQEGETMRYIGESLNVTGSRIQQVIWRVQSEVKWFFSHLYLLPDSANISSERADSGKDALCISDPKGEFLITRMATSERPQKARYIDRCHFGLKKTSEVIRIDRARRMGGREIE